MDADTIKRLKAWFYLRLPTEAWTEFGKDAPQVLQTFDDDPDQENALLRFAIVVTRVATRHLDNNPQLSTQRTRELLRELTQLGINRQQLRRVAGKMFGYE